MLKAVRHHTDFPWVLLYIERWLKAPMQAEDGSVVLRTSGTPQGGVMASVLCAIVVPHSFPPCCRLTRSSNATSRRRTHAAHAPARPSCSYLLAYRSSHPKVFACGDMRRGQSLVVWAIREGRQAAHRRLRARQRHPPGNVPNRLNGSGRTSRLTTGCGTCQ
jgi:hypothetical protein